MPAAAKRSCSGPSVAAVLEEEERRALEVEIVRGEQNAERTTGGRRRDDGRRRTEDGGARAWSFFSIGAPSGARGGEETGGRELLGLGGVAQREGAAGEEAGGEDRQRRFGAGDDVGSEAAREDELGVAVVEGGEDPERGGQRQAGWQVGVAEELRVLRAAESGEDAGDVASRLAVQQRDRRLRVEDGGERGDGSFLVREPAGDGEPAVLQPAGGGGLLEFAPERRVGLGVERLCPGFGDDFGGQGGERRGGVLAVGAEELVEQCGEVRSGLGGRGRSVGGDSDVERGELLPVAREIADLEAQAAGATVRLEKKGVAGGGGGGAAGDGLLHVRPRQAAEAEKGTVVDPRAHIGRGAAGAGDQPAGDPRLAGGKAPVGGVDLESVLPVGALHRRRGR